MLADGAGCFVSGRANWGELNKWRTHDVAIDIAACGDGVEQAGVYFADRGLEVSLDNTVQLKRLPGCNSQGAVGVSPCEVVHGQPLPRRNRAAWDAHANHEAIGRFKLCAMRSVRRSRSSC